MFRGEPLTLRIKGDEQYDLREIDFSVFFYRDGCPATELKKTKSDCVAQEDGSYVCILEPALTASLPLCQYTIEIHDSTNHAIYVQEHAFFLEECASAIDIRDSQVEE